MPEIFGQEHKHVCVLWRKHGLMLMVFLAYSDMVTQQNERVEIISLWHAHQTQIILNND
jgi:hypothetical protein